MKPKLQLENLDEVAEENLDQKELLSRIIHNKKIDASPRNLKAIQDLNLQINEIHRSQELKQIAEDFSNHNNTRLMTKSPRDCCQEDDEEFNRGPAPNIKVENIDFSQQVMKANVNRPPRLQILTFPEKQKPKINIQPESDNVSRAVSTEFDNMTRVISFGAEGPRFQQQDRQSPGDMLKRTTSAQQSPSSSNQELVTPALGGGRDLDSRNL